MPAGDLQVYLNAQVGPSLGNTGTKLNLRAAPTGAIVVAHAHGRHYEMARVGNVYSMALAATTTGIAAGNIVSAAAAASTNFALFNPLNSGKILSLIKFGMGVISGTPAGGPVFHGLIVQGVPSVAGTGSIVSHLTGLPSGSVAKGFATAAGTTLTGGTAPVTLRAANFASTATAQASPGMVPAIEELEGGILLLPGMGWLPLHGGAGTSVLHGYSVTWEEVPYVL